MLKTPGRTRDIRFRGTQHLLPHCALFWIPKATLSAIIVTAVWQIIILPKVFYSYYRTSLADFVASMISFWTTLFVSVEMDIAAAVTFSILHLLLRTVFARLTHVSAPTLPSCIPPLPQHTHPPRLRFHTTLDLQVHPIAPLPQPLPH